MDVRYVSARPVPEEKDFQLQFDFYLVSDGLTTDWTLDVLFGPIVHLDLLKARSTHRVSTRYQCKHVGEWTDGMVCVAHGTKLAKETDMLTGPRTTGTPPVHRPRINTILTEGVSTRDEQRQEYRLERTRRTGAIFTLTQVHVISDFRWACQVDGDAIWDCWTIVMDGAGQHGPDD